MTVGVITKTQISNENNLSRIYTVPDGMTTSFTLWILNPYSTTCTITTRIVDSTNTDNPFTNIVSAPSADIIDWKVELEEGGTLQRTGLVIGNGQHLDMAIEGVELFSDGNGTANGTNTDSSMTFMAKQNDGYDGNKLVIIEAGVETLYNAYYYDDETITGSDGTIYLFGTYQYTGGYAFDQGSILSSDVDFYSVLKLTKANVWLWGYEE